MQSTYKTAIGYILDIEGPELNIGASEPGGASKYGVSVALLTDWHKRQGKPEATVDDVAQITAESASDIYSGMYADPIRYWDLPAGVDYRLLDICVNLGLRGGVSLVQAVLGIFRAPGTMDDETVTALKQGNPKDLILQIGTAWITKKFQAPSWYISPYAKNGFGKGWTKRYLLANRQALEMLE